MTDNEKVITEQKILINNYEVKLKDVVRAYKSIESEKKALEIALSTLFQQNSSISISKIDDVNTGNNVSKSVETEVMVLNANFEQLNLLKQAISTLTIENKKKEMAFQSDRKLLIAKNIQLTKDVNELQMSNNAEITRLKAEIRETASQNEKMLSDHGKIVSEMQQRYAKEHIHCEKIKLQVAELSCRLKIKDDQIKSTENRLKEVSCMDTEILKLRKKADATPTAQLLKKELINVKARYEDELNSVRKKQTINAAVLREKDLRIASFETRIKLLTEESVSAEQEKLALRLINNDLREQLKGSIGNLSCGKIEANENCVVVENISCPEKLINEIRQCCKSLKKVNPNFNSLEILSEFFLPSQDHVQSKDCLLIRNPTPCLPYSINQSKDALFQNCDDNICTFCILAQQKISACQSQILELQRKSAAFEELHRLAKTEHETKSDELRRRIFELESSKECNYSQLTSELKKKVLELEDELMRQQSLIREVVEEKDKEIKHTRNNMLALCSKHRNACDNEFPSVDPLDPEPHFHEDLSKFEIEHHEVRSQFEKADNDSEMKNLLKHIPLNNQQSHGLPFNLINVATIDNTRNVFYEQELVKKENGIFKLRNIARLSELKVCDIEQSMITKDIQCFKVVETLKEEIRSLEGKLSLEKSETNLTYLRNIFIQFINSTNVKSRKHILKAIGAVLKLTTFEMKKIETWNI